MMGAISTLAGLLLPEQQQFFNSSDKLHTIRVDGERNRRLGKHHVLDILLIRVQIYKAVTLTRIGYQEKQLSI